MNKQSFAHPSLTSHRRTRHWRASRPKMIAVASALALAVVLPGTAAAMGLGSLSVGNSRFLATGGIMSLDGPAGGGINPWALIAGYGTRHQIDPTVGYTYVNTPNFTLNDIGVSVGIMNRVEFSVAQQRLEAPDLGLGTFQIKQNIYAMKVRLFGDAVYGQNSWIPQVAVGGEYKTNNQGAVIKSLGARHDSGADFYVAATKLFIGGAFGRDLLLNVNLRFTKANQLGLLGFGGPKSDSYSVEPEFSGAVLLSPKVAVGYEYKSKPDNLKGIQEQPWQDIFLAYFPNKHLSLALAYAQLGTVATLPNQNGLYVNATATW